MQTKIISAFPGTGKTWFVNNSSLKCLDSDSSTFDKKDFPWNYIGHIQYNVGKYDYIFVSSHDVVRDAMYRADIKFICVYPDLSCKKEYIKRYKDRGSSESLINIIEINWQKWIEDLDCAYNFPVIRLSKGLYISDIFEPIASLPSLDVDALAKQKAKEKYPGEMNMMGYKINVQKNNQEKFIEGFKAGYSSSLPQSSTEEEKATRNRDTKYTYYHVDFNNCSAFDGDYMICESLDEVMDLLQLVDINLDDPESEALVEIKGVGMTPAEYDEWFKENN